MSSTQPAPFPGPSPQQGPSLVPAPSAPAYAPAPSGIGIWRIALAVFVGNVLCVLLSLVVSFCFGIAFPLLLGALNSRQP